MKIDDIKKQYDSLKTAIEKYNFWKDIQKLNQYMAEDFKDNIVWCTCCKMPIYEKDLVKTFDTWTETVCTNPLMGYLDDYELKNGNFMNLDIIVQNAIA